MRTVPSPKPDAPPVTMKTLPAMSMLAPGDDRVGGNEPGWLTLT
jgi:hypothetical protein